MDYYIINVETDEVLDGCNSLISAEMKAIDISRREHVETIVIKEGR